MARHGVQVAARLALDHGRLRGCRNWAGRTSAVAASDVKRVLRPQALIGKHATTRMMAGRIVAVLEWAEVENLRERPAAAGRSSRR